MRKQAKSKSKCDDVESAVTQCGLPNVPVRQLDQHLDPGREFLIRYIEKKWVNNTILHYYFFSSPTSWRASDNQKQVVRDAFKEWKQLGLGLQFVEVNKSEDAEIRIGFQRGGS